ncbi:MAG: AAA family ATPase [Candidatus Delongbacteria bacterium]|jgi:predicted AAA+ superfamily ATPase|nr:AAA family ATPase [Candidatus Delongbacteria bacterium]
MNRSAIDYLVKWKNRKDRKPLVIKGARQVGKTWLMKEFGKKHFKNFHYFDFEREKNKWIPVFESDIDPQTILRNLSLIANREIDIDNDLLIFDEVQNIPKALTALKYFYDELPQLAICAAGSLLGIILSEESYPVGKVEYFNLRPLNFKEFLMNYGNKLLYESYADSLKSKTISEPIHLKLMDTLREYLITGGMPEIVSYFIQNKENNPGLFNTIRKKQADLITSFQADFSKHAGKNNSLNISTVYQNISIQLAENVDDSTKRFRFKDVIKGKKSYSQLSGPIEWLVNAELILKVHICNRAELPLKAFCKDNIFKLHYSDIGLLGAMLVLPPSAIILDNYGMNKGYFMENFAAMELLNSNDSQLYSWTERNSEIEFLIIKDNNIFPVEVKSGTRTKAKSLQQYIIKYDPHKAFLLSGKNFSSTNKIKIHIPLYYAGELLNMNVNTEN